jgi:hypothetical protein
MYFRLIFDRFQYTTGASFDATPASSAIIFIDINDFIPVLMSAVHIA